MEQDLVIKKYEELYRLSKEGLDEELSRFKRVDEKASRYFSALSILLVVSGFAGRPTLEAMLPPTTLWDWLSVGCGLALLLSLLTAVLVVFSVLRTSYQLTKMPVSHELVRFFDDHQYLDIIYALSKGNVEAVDENRRVSDQKIFRLAWGYRLILLSIFFMALFMLTIVVGAWNVAP